ncbi:MAG TPA: hypothetical protein VGG01_15415 [Xanthobacteraceae bacterium]
MIVFSGATHPAPLWLDRLAPGGELLLPLTDDNWRGFLLRATRGRDGHPGRIVLPHARRQNTFAATSIGAVGIFPCAGARDDVAAERLHATLAAVFGIAYEDIPIQALHRGDPDPDAMDRVWYHGPGFWLEQRESKSSA